MQAVIAGRLIGLRGRRRRQLMGRTRRAEPSRQEIGKAALMAGIDAELDAHADAQLRLAGRIGDADPHRNPLHHLDPVAAGVLRRQQREARRRRRADAVDRAGPLLSGIGVDLDGRLLSRPDIGQLGFFRARLDPDVVGRDDVEGGGRGGEILAGLQRRHVGHDACEGGVDDRMRELARGLVARGHRVLVFGMIFDRRIGIAVQIGGEAGKLLLQRGKLLLRALQRVLGGVVGCLRREIVGDQLLLALEVDHVEVDVLLRLLDLGLHVAVTGLQRAEIVARAGELRIGPVQRELELLRIELEQDLALRDLLVVVDIDLADEFRKRRSTRRPCRPGHKRCRST